MTVFKLKKGLDIPIQGKPAQQISPARPITTLALLGRDYPGLKPTMAVREGEEVKGGQLLFSDKKNPGVNFTAPGGGIITAINRGPKRLFESIVIQLNAKRRNFPSRFPPQTTAPPSALSCLNQACGRPSEPGRMAVYRLPEPRPTPYL